jgi:pSer/pThr/pTyr-binding forkhead associated (FHA) protein
VGKLVLFLKDANPVEIPLDKERVTIGRRADNDVCLPYPAVSGEHAAIVTILADSFLEDLGSTNGTLVNGRPIAKHFLRDRDQVDIGRQLLVYLADAEAPAEPSAPVVREDVRESGRWVEPVRPAERVEPTLAAAIDDDLGLAVGSPGAERGTWRTEPALRRGAGPRAAPGARVPTEGVADETTFDAELAAIRQGRADATRPPEPEPDEKSVAAPVARGRLRVLTGPSAGRLVDIARDEFVLGRVGVQVAAIEWRDGALHLRPREGAAPPSVNGEPVPPEGRRIGPGDGLEVAGTRLEVVAE